MSDSNHITEAKLRPTFVQKASVNRLRF